MSARAGAGRPRVLYYAHHQGSGHRRHAARLARLGVAEITIAGTGLDALAREGLRTVELPPDDVDPHVEPQRSPFHWTPRTPAVRERFAVLHDALETVRPELVISDVSVEVAAFAALAGYPVAMRRMPGDRGDRAHELGYDLAERLLAYYPRAVEDPAFAAERAGRCRWLGMPEPDSGGPRDPDERVEPAADAPIVVIVGTGGEGLAVAELARAARATPGRRWIALGDVDVHEAPPPNLELAGRISVPGRVLAGAGVIVAGAGHNTVADVAAARRPALLIPEERPHREQAAFAERIGEEADVATAASWSAIADWPGALADAASRPADALAELLLVSEREFAASARDAIDEAIAAGRD